MADVQEDSVFFGIEATSKGATREVNKLTSSIGKLNKVVSALKIGTWIAGIKGMATTASNAIEKTLQLVSAENKFKLVVGEASQATQEFLNKAEKLGKLDMAKVKDAYASFASLTKGFHLPEKEVDLMSRNLTQLVADMSAFGFGWDNAMQKVKSGISGEIEPMRAIGVALDKNTLQQTANALGIKRKVDEMTRAQKTELLYYQMMKSTEHIQGTMAKTIMSPTQALRIMKTEFLTLAREVGAVFIPIMMKIIPVVRAVVAVLLDAVRWIAKFFGIDISNFEIQLDTVDTGLKNIDNGIGDIGDTTKKTKKELDKMLMGFDELNNITFNKNNGTGSGTGTIGAGGGSLGIDLPEYDMFKGLTDDISAQVENIKNKIEEWKPVIIAVTALAGALFLAFKFAEFVKYLADIKKAFSELGGLDFFRIVAGLALEITGATLIFMGVKHAIDIGKMDAKSFLLTLAGGSLIVAGLALQFKNPAILGIGLAITLTIEGVMLLASGIKESVQAGNVTPESLLKIICGSELIYAGAMMSFKKPVNLKIGLIISLSIAGLSMLFGGLSKSIKEGGVTGESLLEMIGGGALIGIAGGLKFGTPVGLAITLAITFLVTAGTLVSWWIKYFDDEKKKMSNYKKELNLGDYIHIGFSAMGKGIVKNVIDKIFGEGNFDKWIQDNSENIVNFSTGLQDLAKNISITGNTDLSNLIDNFKNFGQGIDNVKNKISKFGEDFSSWKDDVIKKAGDVKEKAGGKLKDFAEKGKDNFENLKNNETNKFETMKNNISEKLETTKTNVKNKTEDIKKDITDKFETAKNNATDKFETMKKNVKDKFKDIKTNISTWAEDIKTKITNKFETAKTNVTNKFSDMKTKIGNVFSQLWTKIKKPINSILGGIENMANGVVDGINTVIRALNRVKIKIPDWSPVNPGQTFGFNIDELSHVKIPQLKAEGGFVDKGQMFIARENGAELVGNIGRKTAVANNDQITEGIAVATYEAFSRALAENKASGDDTTPYFNVYVGNDKIYSGYAKQKNRDSNMYGIRI